MFSCFIVDDEISTSTLAGYISLVDHITLIGSSSSPKGILNKLIITKPDIVFIDIDLARKFQSDIIQLISVSTLIITGRSQADAYEALELSAIDFLLKPIEYSAFLRTIIKTKKIRLRELEKGIQSLIESNSHFFVKKDSKGKKIVKIRYQEILYIEGSQNYVSIITDEEKHLAYLTMKEIEQSLPSDRFVRVHKSYIVNVDQIKMVDGNQILLDNEQKILMSVSYRPTVLRKLNEKLLRSKRNQQRDRIQIIS